MPRHPEVWSAIQRARGELGNRTSKANARKRSITPEQYDQLAKGLAQAYGIMKACLDAAGMRGTITLPERAMRQMRAPGGGATADDPTHRGSISYTDQKGKRRKYVPESHFGLPAEVLPESIWKRAERRLEAEVGDDVPDGYWARKTRLYQAALEECVEDCDRPELKARQILTLISMFHSMKDVYLRKGELPKRIGREEEEAMEAEVSQMSDEELLKLEKGE